MAFIRASSFLGNYTPSLNAAASTGWFDTYLTPTDPKFPMVATADIGKEASRRLVSGWGGMITVELSSRTSPSNRAHAMSEVLGRPVQARSIARGQRTASLEAQGLPPGFIISFEAMQAAFNSAWIDVGARSTDAVAGLTGACRVFAHARKR